MKPIEYGMFIMPFHDADKPLAVGYDEDLELIVRAEELGFTDFWIGEHHTLKYETIVMPEMFIARALGETSRIRMGPSPVCLNQHHPAHVASRLAFLDHLSKGRLNLCIAPSSVTADQELYGVDPAKGGEMVEESWKMIQELWSSDPPYHLDGKYWKIHVEKYCDEETLIGYIHKPYQRPHPPVSMAGTSRNSYSMKTAGRFGYAPIAAALIAANVVADNWQTYAEAAEQSGRTPDRNDFSICRTIFLADTTAEAEQRVRTNSLGKLFQYVCRIFDKGLGRKILKRDLDMPDSECNLDYLMTEQIIAGDVDEVLRRLMVMREETGDFGKLILMSFDWDDKQSWVHSMELFANELMPALNREVGAVATEEGAAETSIEQRK